MAKKNYYKILGVSRTASPEEISAAKNRLAKKYHPDANMKDGIDTTKKMQRILEAYRILSDPKKRASYDRKVSESHRQTLTGISICSTCIII